ncbi:hypothetical protein MRB53_038890 [Persea americana]|nr:hypothetical protein MRB53_038890 [Persea americana]
MTIADFRHGMAKRRQERTLHQFWSRIRWYLKDLERWWRSRKMVSTRADRIIELGSGGRDSRRVCSKALQILLSLKHQRAFPFIAMAPTGSSDQRVTPLLSLVAGGTAGGIEATITYPFEFAKTRVQLRAEKGIQRHTTHSSSSDK